MMAVGELAKNENQTLEALLLKIPQEGGGAQASSAVTGIQADLLSNAVPPLQEVPVLQP